MLLWDVQLDLRQNLVLLLQLDHALERSDLLHLGEDFLLRRGGGTRGVREWGGEGGEERRSVSDRIILLLRFKVQRELEEVGDGESEVSTVSSQFEAESCCCFLFCFG